MNLRLRNLRLAAIVLILSPLAASGARATSQKAGEQDKYFKKWINEDVVYIISPEERDTFLKLRTAEEKEHFIEQFWMRRNPAPNGAVNEFKEEHYRRIAYANEHFHSGVDGWRTDRGMVYIKYGPPTSIEKHPEGGSYIRKSYEGGGMTSTYPFEIWFYRHIDGVGDGIEIEFVDASKTNEYRIAQDPNEKDALLYVPGAGQTLAESLGMQSRYDRLRVRYIGNQDSGNIHDINPAFQPLRIQDYPMQRLETLYKLEKSPPIRFKDLESVVSVKVSYNQLPFKFRADTLQLSNDVALVPVTLSFKKGDLSYKQDAAGVSRATVEIYGRVESLQGRLVHTFEDTFQAEVRDASREKDLGQYTLFQKRLPLTPGRYKLSLIAKDESSGNTTTMDQLLLVPRSSVAQLTSSSIILTPQVLPVPNGSSVEEPFVFGKYKVIPTLGDEFVQADRFVQAYFEVYNLDLDQESLKPSVKVEIALLKDGHTIFPYTALQNEFEFEGDRLLVHKTIPFNGLSAGRYTVLFRISDEISRRSVEPRVDFFLK